MSGLWDDNDLDEFMYLEQEIGAYDVPIAQKKPEPVPQRSNSMSYSEFAQKEPRKSSAAHEQRRKQSKSVQRDVDRAAEEYDLIAAAKERYLKKKRLLDAEYDRAKQARDQRVRTEHQSTRQTVSRLRALEKKAGELETELIQAQTELDTLEAEQTTMDRQTQSDLTSLNDQLDDVAGQTEDLDAAIAEQEAELQRLKGIVDIQNHAPKAEAGVGQGKVYQTKSTKASPPARTTRPTHDEPVKGAEYAQEIAALPYATPEVLQQAVEDDIAEYCTSQETVVRRSNERVGVKYATGARAVQFSNGTMKYILPDGGEVVKFYNGDVKKAAADGTQIYLYADVQTLLTTLPDKTEIFRFKTGQIERHVGNKSVKIFYPNGEVKTMAK